MDGEVSDDGKYGEDGQDHNGHKKKEDNEQGDVPDDDKYEDDGVIKDGRAMEEGEGCKADEKV